MGPTCNLASSLLTSLVLQLRQVSDVTNQSLWGKVDRSLIRVTEDGHKWVAPLEFQKCHFDERNLECC